MESKWLSIAGAVFTILFGAGLTGIWTLSSRLATLDADMITISSQVNQDHPIIEKLSALDAHQQDILKRLEKLENLQDQVWQWLGPLNERITRQKQREDERGR